MHTAWLALAFGAIAAIALPVGAYSGLRFTPPSRVTSAMLAFGAGTLIFALSVEIVAGAVERGGFLPVGSGMVIGGVVFAICNQLLNQRGAFLRKISVAAAHVAKQRRRRHKALLGSLSQVHLLRSLPPGHIAPLVQATQIVTLAQGQELFREGDAGDSLYLIDQGELEVIRGGVRAAVLTPGDTVGEMAMVTGGPRNATIRAIAPARLLCIPKPAFDQLMQSAPDVRDRVAAMVATRAEDLRDKLLVSRAEADAWMRAAAARLNNEEDATPEEIEKAAHEQKNAPLGIWLGNLLDSVPEAIVLGATVTGVGSVSWPLLAGIFIDNFPEAMSSSSLMRIAGLGRRRILLMWWSAVLVSGLCAALGNMFFIGAAETTFGVVEGTAAGAMLVMIAETTLPEAYERGGAIVGLSTLCGFLAALAIKSIS